MKIKKHWYLIHSNECPVCGRGSTWRERRYGKKPKNKKFSYVQVYDFCIERGIS